MKMDQLIPPDPEEFFQDGLELMEGTTSPTEPTCVYPTCQTTSVRVWQIKKCHRKLEMLYRFALSPDGSADDIHKGCLLHYFTRLPAHDSCPECNVVHVQRMPLPMKMIAERHGVEVEAETLSEPIVEFGRTHHTEEEIHKTERELMVAIVESCLSWEIKYAKEDRRPEYRRALSQIFHKMNEVALPHSKYLICDKAHEQAQWHAGIAKYVVDRLKELHLASFNTREFCALQEECDFLHANAEEELDSHYAQLWYDSQQSS
ncbi:hypothetical protein K491DRAFT_368628 [Lophiostoma macrostomum CBS 122681]|uniref:Uncharacterized protein n=1 Tax=Lophiostoma macrostomum CBS 122681 TaxID=1314788 RepID=A0A6A6TAB1_9PLEO|nr:hypothetical protein K491DRAFT_368628 [Lophiostoma macrostomum CBS 122681]